MFVEANNWAINSQIVKKYDRQKRYHKPKAVYTILVELELLKSNSAEN